jgi:hypothetical protein
VIQKGTHFYDDFIGKEQHGHQEGEEDDDSKQEKEGLASPATRL